MIASFARSPHLATQPRVQVKPASVRRSAAKGQSLPPSPPAMAMMAAPGTDPVTAPMMVVSPVGARRGRTHGRRIGRRVGGRLGQGRGRGAPAQDGGEGDGDEGLAHIESPWTRRPKESIPALTRPANTPRRRPMWTPTVRVPTSMSAPTALNNCSRESIRSGGDMATPFEREDGEAHLTPAAFPPPFPAPVLALRAAANDQTRGDTECDLLPPPCSPPWLDL